jgi:hypothetical protein
MAFEAPPPGQVNNSPVRIPLTNMGRMHNSKVTAEEIIRIHVDGADGATAPETLRHKGLLYRLEL